MYITEICELFGKRAKKVRIRMDDGSAIIMYRREAERYGLSDDSEISTDLWEQLLNEVFIPRARSRAMHLLEKQDRTRRGLYRKLSESGYPDEAIDQAISYVESYHYIDDDRYAASYVRYHQYGKSRRRISMDLKSKGVDDEVIRRAIEQEYTASEEEMIRDILLKKHFDISSGDVKKRRQMYRFLIGRGFAYEDIDRVFH